MKATPKSQNDSRIFEFIQNIKCLSEIPNSSHHDGKGIIYIFHDISNTAITCMIDAYVNLLLYLPASATWWNGMIKKLNSVYARCGSAWSVRYISTNFLRIVPKTCKKS